MDYVGKYTLDARPDRIDVRDREYTPPLRGLAKKFPSTAEVELFFPLYAEHEMVLDQGTEGACTGFGLAAMINYLIWKEELAHSIQNVQDSELRDVVPPAKVSMRMLYHLARFYDEWPGEDYQGSSCRGAVKAWHRHGVCSDTLWPYRDKNRRVKFIEPAPEWAENAAHRPLGVYYRIQKDALTDMQAAIQEVGAIYVSANVHSGWNVDTVNKKACHENLPMISWKKGIAKTGGHAFALVGYNEFGFIVQNSWGEDWGLKGFALLAYDDWIENGTDSWVCVMGVPKKVQSPSHYVASKSELRKITSERQALLTLGLSAATSSRHIYQDEDVQPWSDDEAYQHTVVMENDGRVINRIVTKNTAEDSVEYLVFNSPRSFFSSAGATARPRLVIYAHGGLNSEEDSIRRIKVLGPYFRSNGIYPLFFTWKTGVIESLVGMLEDAVKSAFDRVESWDDILRSAKRRAEDVLDRTLEIGSARLGVKALWSQMKQNAAEAAKKGAMDRGAFLTSLALKRLKEEIPDLEIHLIGHSAGSFILGNMLGDFPRNDLKVKTFSLYAPACSLDFANRHFMRALEKGVLKKEELFIDLLGEQRELDDSVGPYRKSLLYLVSRALEEYHKTPLLGLAAALNPANNGSGIWSPQTQSHLKKWQKLGYWGSDYIQLLDEENVVTARKWTGAGYENISHIPAAHGSFDNDVEIVEKTIVRILGETALQHRVENLRY